MHSEYVQLYNLLCDSGSWRRATSFVSFNSVYKVTIHTREVVSTKYAIDLKKDKTVLDIIDIIRKDGRAGFKQELWEIIGKVDGVIDVDYDGHFGNYIYVEIDTERDTKDTWKLIYKLINQYSTIIIRKDK